MPLKDAPDLWANLSLEDIADLIRHSARELKRLYALKAADDELPPQRRDIAVLAGIAAYEHAHDQHLEWYRLAARKAGENRPIPF